MRCIFSRLRTSSFLWIGDFNARISNAQTLDKHVIAGSPFISRTRSSKDSVLNSEGKKLVEVLENIFGIVENGKINGGITSNFTFCGAMGKSVIDYAICSADFWKHIKNLNIPSKVFFRPYAINTSYCCLLSYIYGTYTA